MYLVSKIESKKLLLILLAAKALFLGWVIAFYMIHLAPDEAQYWTWSQALDWGYYSKPPAIAWQIALTTAMFGNTELGVRFGALIIGFIFPLILFSSAKKIGLREKTAFWAAIMVAFSPIGFLVSFAATTDGGAILFFTLAILTAAKGAQKSEGPSYPLIGLWVLLGALYKWVAFAAWAFILVFFLFHSSFRKKSLLGGLLISLIALLPSLYWNISHDWATFKHVGTTLVNSASHAKGNLPDFLAAQIGILSPIYAILLVGGMFAIFKGENRSKKPLVICAVVTCAALIYLGLAFFKKMQPNWAMYLYPPGFLVAAWWASEKHPKGVKWLHIGTWLSVVGVLVALSIPFVQAKGWLPIPYQANPFRQNMGWEKIPSVLSQAGYNPEKEFLFADKYQAVSLLSFYGPKQKQAYFFNLNLQRKNQFSYVPQMAEREIGKTGFFVLFEQCQEKDLPWYESHYKMALKPFFDAITLVGNFPIFQSPGKPLKFALIFRSENYNGKAPISPEKY